MVVNSYSAYSAAAAADSNQLMVNLVNYISPLITDWKYATDSNFTHTVLYTNPAAFARLPAARALQQVQAALTKKGLSLKFYDAYRPYAVTQQMWAVVPDDRYAANPAKGSGHNRGAAFDVSIVELSTGRELPMPTPFDDFTEKAHHDYMQLPANVLANRQLLKTVMEKYGFTALSTEWWHYSLPNAAARFPLLNLSFDDLRKTK
ncbi:M15 family metallopeptidase [Deminuibacter soli]|uniref:M15 family metallopeptidase n=1 Tax=Deminuibacter soli TaxID=2291815 RepID=UPI001313ECE9|nr:M15 family metallopeptidase [Deminuibacter soli]